jgi:fluoroacetyl-CoA thioesterase
VRFTLQTGLTATLTYPVTVERTVPHLLPESEAFAAMPQVLATGYLVGVVEWTCMRALAGHLDEGEQTLGVHIDVSHLAPTPAGATVWVSATLTHTDAEPAAVASARAGAGAGAELAVLGPVLRAGPPGGLAG